MADYERRTPWTMREVFATAEAVFTESEMKRTRESRHSAAYAGPEGTLNVQVHWHGNAAVVVATTNQLHTSKLDGVVRHFLNQLPYQPGDPPRSRSAVGG